MPRLWSILVERNTAIGRCIHQPPNLKRVDAIGASLGGGDASLR